jgi:hypothetical protein
LTPFNKPFGRPFDKLMVLSIVEGLMVPSDVEGLMALNEIEGPFDILLVDYIITSNI